MKTATRKVQAGSIQVGGDAPLLLIAGPCVMESRDLLHQIAESLLAQTSGLPFTLVFKASYDKANRSSRDAFRGPGLEQGLPWLAEIRDTYGLPILSDVHTPEEARAARDVLDILQIPAFLCRQNDLLWEAGRTGKLVNIKKGQFMAPGDMVNRAAAAEAPEGPPKTIITERGTFFGYRNLVNDFKGVASMRRQGIPVIFDATHSVQLPGSLGGASGGERAYVPMLAAAACAAGIDGFFFEVHPDPDKALCDGPNSLPLNQLGPLLKKLAAIDDIVRE